MEAKILDKIRQGEGINIEFKECKDKLNKDVYETVCAFLNRNGGELFLGVKDNGEIGGVNPGAIEQIKKDFVTSINNGNKISPTYYLSIEDFEIEGRHILYIFVPESSQVHRCNGRIFDRNEDGDINITDHTNLVASLYEKKQLIFSENTVYRYVKFEDLRQDIIDRARKLATIQKRNHPWSNLTDMELLQSAGLYTRNYKTNEEGFTLAAVLLLGKDEVIRSIIPYHKTDAILRRVNIDRYDDRDDIRTNLIESYDRLMAFVAKHLPDKFYLEEGQRINIRDYIFREVVANILIHREYNNPYPAKLVIGNDEIYTENSNKPHGYGLIDPNNFSPFPKNPVIAQFFKEIGWADELGSGVRNIYKYCKVYFKDDPKIIEEDIFKIILPASKMRILDTNPASTPQVPRKYPASHEQLESTYKGLLDFCREPKTRTEIQQFMNLKDREYLRKNVLKPLIEHGLIMLTLPDKPQSSKQKYCSKKD